MRGWIHGVQRSILADIWAAARSIVGILPKVEEESHRGNTGLSVQLYAGRKRHCTNHYIAEESGYWSQSSNGNPGPVPEAHSGSLTIDGQNIIAIWQILFNVNNARAGYLHRETLFGNACDRNRAACLTTVTMQHPVQRDRCGVSGHGFSVVGPACPITL
jgi:hypothetical protein